MQQSRKHHEMIEYIQILRFIVAIWVAIFHGTFFGMFIDVAPWMSFVINLGYAGVDIFFIISGVIMAHSTKNTPSGARHAGTFLLIRFSRIYIGWWPVMLLYIIFFKMAHQLSPQVNLQASFFLYFTELSELINVVTWTLMFELYFYTIISFSLLFQERHRQFFLKILFTILLLMNIYLLMVRSADVNNSEPNWIHMFYVAPITAEFFMGYFLYHYTKNHFSPSWKTWGGIAVALMALATYLMPNFANHPYGLANFYYWPERTVLMGSAALALVGMALKLPSPRNKIALMLTKFGGCSYAIYLLHILAFNIMIFLLPWDDFNSNYRIIFTLVTMVVLLLVSAMYYHWVEHPAYNFFS